MELFIYPATVVPAQTGDDFVVRFKDLPEVLTFGDTIDEALENAPDALGVIIEAYLEKGMAVPTPRAPEPGEYAVILQPEVAARVALHRQMAAEGLTNVALAKRMNRDEKAIRRILTGKNASFSLTLEALKASGLRPALGV